MLTRTTVSGIRALIYVALHGNDEPVPPHRIAECLNASPTYMAKTTNMLVKANILRAHRGAQGGVILARAPEQISLLEIVEACQGQIVGDFCQEAEVLRSVCAFHRAMVELHEAMVGVLARWTLADLVAKPFPDEGAVGTERCCMRPLLCFENRS